MKTIVIIFCSLIFESVVAFAADIKFETQHAELELPARKNEEKVEFKFKNTGKETVKIVGMRASCGCTVPKLEKKEYQPEEKGEISVIYTRATGVEKNKATILVVTDEESDNFYMLTLDVTQKEIMKLSSYLLNWQVGEEGTEKKVEVSITDAPLNIAEVRTSNDIFDVKLSTVEPFKKYIVTVKPNSCKLPAKAAIRLFTEQGDIPVMTVAARILQKEDTNKQ